eukprot:6184778-Pleurochrysis_carterae.AAC.1
MVAAHGDASKTSVLRERELEARVGQDGSGVASAELPAPAQLLMSADPHKDQTYFLSQLRQVRRAKATATHVLERHRKQRSGAPKFRVEFGSRLPTSKNGPHPRCCLCSVSDSKRAT